MLELSLGIKQTHFVMVYAIIFFVKMFSDFVSIKVKRSFLDGMPLTEGVDADDMISVDVKAH